MVIARALLYELIYQPEDHGLTSHASKDLCDGAHSIGVQNVTSNCNVATLISFIFSLYLARRLAWKRLSFAGKIYENNFLAFEHQ